MDKAIELVIKTAYILNPQAKQSDILATLISEGHKNATALTASIREVRTAMGIKAFVGGKPNQIINQPLYNSIRAEALKQPKPLNEGEIRRPDGSIWRPKERVEVVTVSAKTIRKAQIAAEVTPGVPSKKIASSENATITSSFGVEFEHPVPASTKFRYSPGLERDSEIYLRGTKGEAQFLADSAAAAERVRLARQMLGEVR